MEATYRQQLTVSMTTYTFPPSCPHWLLQLSAQVPFTLLNSCHKYQTCLIFLSQFVFSMLVLCLQMSHAAGVFGQIIDYDQPWVGNAIQIVRRGQIRPKTSCMGSALVLQRSNTNPLENSSNCRICGWQWRGETANLNVKYLSVIITKLMSTCSNYCLVTECSVLHKYLSLRLISDSTGAMLIPGLFFCWIFLILHTDTNTSTDSIKRIRTTYRIWLIYWTFLQVMAVVT